MVDDRTAADWTVVYEKGAWVMWMLENHMGREALLRGLQTYIRTFYLQPQRPTLRDFLDLLRPQAPDAEAFDAFVTQWFFDIVLPEFRLSNGTVSADGGRWTVSVTIENVGTGRVDLELAALRGVRFAAEGTHLDARTPVVKLGPGEARSVSWIVPFPPERIVVDPDARVLQRRRQEAEVTLAPIP